MDMMIVTINAKCPVEHRVFAVAMYRYPRPPSQGPAIFTRTFDEGVTSVDFVLGSLYFLY
jgi:hypothetical protein